MTILKDENSPQLFARIGGLAYLFIIIAGAMGELFIRNTIVVAGDPAATARNIADHQLLWRIGIAADLLMHVCDLVVAIVYYTLFKRVNKTLAILAVLFGMIQTAVLVANKLNLVIPTFFLGNEEYLQAFTLQQRQVLSYIAIKSHDLGFGIGLIFFGFECLIDGYLVRLSGFLPRILGWLLMLVGICYLANSFVLILAPQYSATLFPILMAPIFIGELSMCLWLLFKGVDMERWKTA